MPGPFPRARIPSPSRPDLSMKAFIDRIQNRPRPRLSWPMIAAAIVTCTWVAAAAWGQGDAANPDAAKPQAAGGAGWVAETWDTLSQAGWIGIVLLLLSIFALGFAVERLVRLRRSRIAPRGLASEVDKLVKAGQVDQAQKLAGDSDSILGRIIALLLDHRGVNADEARVLAEEVGTNELKLHHQKAYPLLVCGNLAPLLGLLGTVIGLIGAFQVIALAGDMGDPSLFAEEIGFAMMTTAIGLVVAIPLLALYHFFKTRTVQLAIELEQQVIELTRRWFVRGELASAKEPTPNVPREEPRTVKPEPAPVTTQPAPATPTPTPTPTDPEASHV